MLWAMLTLSIASAQDCDSAALVKELKDASPHAATSLYIELAQCDVTVALKQAATTIPTLIGTDAGFEAAVEAVKVGAGDTVREWMGVLERDERARAIRALGKQCSKHIAVQEFFKVSEADMGDQFWSDRWYRALTDCRVPSVAAMLSDKVDAGIGENRGLYFAVVEAYASNAGMGAVDKLKSLILEANDVELQVNLIGAFPDAAQVGTLDGADYKIAEAASAAIVSLAEVLPAKAVDQARITLVALGDEASADALAKTRFNAVLQDDGGLLYGTVVVENALCKNGKPAQRVHIAEVHDPGQTWPDQLVEKILASITITWKLNLAERCKGKGEMEILVPNSPFADKAEFKVWVQKQLKVKLKASVKRPVRVDEEPIQL